MKQGEFSVLISVYEKEKPEFLKAAFDSIINQSLLPGEIVLIEDGKLTDELYAVIHKIDTKGIPFRKFSFSENKGLATALNSGLMKCKYSIVARMDSDDVSEYNRFELEYNYLMENPDVCMVGGQIHEFVSNPEVIASNRIVPTEHVEIINRLKLRNPFNHMTVMYRKEAVIAAGGYPNVNNVEDYLLWAKLVARGYTFHNLPEFVVRARIGEDMVSRRTGIEYFKNEMKVQQYMLSADLSDLKEFVVFGFTRGVARVIPRKALAQIYHTVLRK